MRLNQSSGYANVSVHKSCQYSPFAHTVYPACNSDGFILQDSATCPAGTGFIENDGDCSAAAISLGLSDTTVGSAQWTDAERGDYPHGCYFKESNAADQQLWRNPGGDRNDGDTDRVYRLALLAHHATLPRALANCRVRLLARLGPRPICPAARAATV